jgi:folate-binding protein YgfZ
MDAVVVDDGAVLEDRVVVRHVDTSCHAPWFDKLTHEATEDLIPSLSKDEVRAYWIPAFAGMTRWKMTTHLRGSRALFRFSGSDAQKLLSDVVTGRLLAQEGPAVWWALLSPQGKVQAEGLSVWHDGAFWLDLDASAADDFLRRMKLYRLRAKVEIADLRETHAVGWRAEGPDDDVAYLDPRGSALCWHIISTKAGAADWSTDDISWHWARISEGIPELGSDFPADENFPHDLGMDLLGGIDFKKGCYIGQEVVSRMEHRGTARRRPAIVEGEGIEKGMWVLSGGRDVGTLGMAVNGKAVAIVRLDRLTVDGAATVSGTPVKLAIPSWGTYRFGESGSAE